MDSEHIKRIRRELVLSQERFAHPLVITAVTGQRKYRKEVDLPGPVASVSAVSSYHNGVLEVKLARRRDPGASDGRRA